MPPILISLLSSYRHFSATILIIFYLNICAVLPITGKERNETMKFLKNILKALTISMIVFFVVKAFISAYAMADGLKALLP